jgi:MYXO-CTERM domain-containing protein
MSPNTGGGGGTDIGIGTGTGGTDIMIVLPNNGNGGAGTSGAHPPGATGSEPRDSAATAGCLCKATPQGSPVNAAVALAVVAALGLQRRRSQRQRR